MPDPIPRISDAEILALRPPRQAVDPNRPYAWLTEPECSFRGEIVSVQTIFLTNRECPYRCLMCDLWKNTLEESVSAGTIPAQIAWAIEQLPPGREIKLYNSGNFFDRKAIPPDDYQSIAHLVQGYETVVIENHPNLCDERCVEFQKLISPAQLEVAMGLESSDPEILAALNKRMTLADFDRAVEFLHQEGIRTRAFILLNPPFVERSKGIESALATVEYAQDRGVNCCSLIATRAGSGILNRLQNEGKFQPPEGESLEKVLEAGLARGKGRVFVDLWEAESLFPCPDCRALRLERLRQMNLTQRMLPAIVCPEGCR